MLQSITEALCYFFNSIKNAKTRKYAKIFDVLRRRKLIHLMALKIW